MSSKFQSSPQIIKLFVVLVSLCIANLILHNLMSLYNSFLYKEIKDLMKLLVWIASLYGKLNKELKIKTSKNIFENCTLKLIVF